MTYSVEIKKLSYSFGKTKALDDLSFAVEVGEIFGIIGADGAGKTTLLRLLCDLLTVQEGKLVTNTKKIVYMPQKFSLYEELTVLENLKLYADIKNVPHDFDAFLEMTALKGFESRYAGKLSGGMKQKLGLICVLLGNPKIVILDEPSVGVDPLSRRELVKMVRASAKQGTTIIWSTAYLDEAFNFDKILLLDKGKNIFYGSPYGLSTEKEDFANKVIELMGGVPHTEFPLKVLPPFEEEYTIIADNLHKYFGSFCAVKENTFQIKKGEIFGILGPNGAGKTTTFKMLCGLNEPSKGSVTLMGMPMKDDPSKARAFLGYMAQKFSLYQDLTLYDNLDFFANLYNTPSKEIKQRMAEIIELFEFQPFLKIIAKELPLGIMQKLSFAVAIFHNPPLLFLDEPTSGVDPVARQVFWQQIRALAKNGTSILITTHFMDEAEFCDRMSLFYHGETIAIGTPEELKNMALRLRNSSNVEVSFFGEDTSPSQGRKPERAQPLCKGSLPQPLISSITMEDTFIALIEESDRKKSKRMETSPHSDQTLRQRI